MGPTSAIVLYAMIWFGVFFVVLPLRLKTQGEAGEVVPGTHSSAPADPQIKRKAIVTTLVATVLWALIAGIILSGWITVRDLDWFQRMATPDLTSGS
jgi:predicted secreted protein